MAVTPLNQCSLCGEDFASLEAFDEHFIGRPEDPIRGCLPVDEIPTTKVAGGPYRLNARGRWELSARADAARETFGRRRRGLPEADPEP